MIIKINNSISCAYNTNKVLAKVIIYNYLKHEYIKLFNSAKELQDNFIIGITADKFLLKKHDKINV